MTDVVAYQSASLDARVKYANTLAAAGQLIPKGLFDPATGKPSPPKVLLVMETGSMLGLHPMAALQSIDVVEGRATLSAKLMGALIRKAGHKLSIVKSGSIPTGDYSVTVTLTRADGGDEFTSTWDIPRAIRAGLVDSYERGPSGRFEVKARTDRGAKKPWEAYAETMPVWRGVSEVGREGAADVLFGLYGTEEMTDGGIPLAEPDPEPTEDWDKLIAEATSRAELNDIAERLAEKREGTDKIRARWLARAGAIHREANTVDAEVVPDEPQTADEGAQAPQDVEAPQSPPSTPAPSSAPTEMSQEEYEAAEAARFDAEQEAARRA